SFGLVDGARPASHRASLLAGPARSAADVFLGGNLSHEQIVSLGSTLAARGRGGVLLLDSMKSSPYHKLFLHAFRPHRVVPIGAFPNGITEIEERLGTKPASAVEWKRGPPLELWRSLFPTADTVVICPAEPHRLLLQAACLAGVSQAPLLVVHDDPRETKELRQLLIDWQTHTILAVGKVDKLWHGLPEMQLVRLADEQAVAAAYLRRQLKNGPIDTLVVANPSDIKRPGGVMSPLAPWVALNKRAFLILTNEDGDNVAAIVDSALRRHSLRHIDNLILVADLLAIPM